MNTVLKKYLINLKMYDIITSVVKITSALIAQLDRASAF